MSSGPIQVIPPGFLGMLQLKNGGENPREIPTDLKPTLEMLKWYLNADAQKMSATNATRLGATPGLDGWVVPTAGTITVPPGEWWYVHSILAWGIMPAATTEFLALAPGWVEPNNFLDFEIPEPHAPLLQGAAASTRRYFSVARDFWAPPGVIFAWYVVTLESATTMDLFLNGRITRLPI